MKRKLSTLMIAAAIAVTLGGCSGQSEAEKVEIGQPGGWTISETLPDGAEPMPEGPHVPVWDSQWCAEQWAAGPRKGDVVELPMNWDKSKGEFVIDGGCE